MASASRRLPCRPRDHLPLEELPQVLTQPRPDGKIYIFGGYPGCCSYPVYLRGVYVYDPGTDAWTPRASMPTGREGAAAALASNGKIYVAGGWTPQGMIAPMEEYDPRTDTWAIRAPMPIAGDHAPLVAGDDGKLYTFGGRSGYVRQYDPATDTWIVLPMMPTPRGWLAAAALGNGKIYTFGGFSQTHHSHGRGLRPMRSSPSESITQRR